MLGIVSVTKVRRRILGINSWQTGAVHPRLAALINLDVPNITAKSEDSHVQQQDTLTSAIMERDVTLVQLTLAFAGNTQHLVQVFFRRHQLPLKVTAMRPDCVAPWQRK
jgi:hypothetical protein